MHSMQLSCKCLGTTRLNRIAKSFRLEIKVDDSSRLTSSWIQGKIYSLYSDMYCQSTAKYFATVNVNGFKRF